MTDGDIPMVIFAWIHRPAVGALLAAPFSGGRASPAPTYLMIPGYFVYKTHTPPGNELPGYIHSVPRGTFKERSQCPSSKPWPRATAWIYP